MTSTIEVLNNSLMELSFNLQFVVLFYWIPLFHIDIYLISISCFVVVKYNGARKKTRRIEQNYSPRWDETVKFKLDENKTVVNIRVYVR